ncbi:MAG TPA: hypothetical protein VGE60_09800 [Telluria sp.]
MDQQKLRTLVFERTGVRIDVDDPVFALVALNEAVLEEAVERHVAAIDQASRELAAHARAVGGIAAPLAAPGLPGVLAQEKRTIAIAAGSAVLGALVVLLAQAALA